MIDLTEVKTSSNAKPQETYVPELETTVYTGRDTTAGIAKELSISKQDGSAASYFGEIDLNTNKERIGFFENAFLTAPRAFGRGLVNLYGSFRKAGVLGKEFYEKELYEIERSGFWKDKERQIEEMYVTGEIDETEYQNKKKALSDEIGIAVRQDIKNKDIERQATQEQLQKITLWNERVIKELGIQSREGENKTLSAIFESAPTTLAAIGTFLVTKNPVLLPTLFGATTVVPQAADIAAREIELGSDLNSALEVGAVTGIASGSLDFIGLEAVTSLWRAPMRQAVTKSRVFNKLSNFVYQNADKAGVKNLGTYLRMGAVAAGEEGITETAQAAIEANVPRYLGKGEKFEGLYNELMDYAFQGWVGAISGGLFGSIGSAISLHNVKKGVFQNMKEKGLSDVDAQAVAETIAPVLVEHGDSITKELNKEIQNLDTSKKGVSEAVKVLNQALEPEEIETIRKGFEDMYDSKFQQGKGNANTIASYIATSAAMIEAEMEGVPTDNAANKMKWATSQFGLEVSENSDGLDVSDKFYNARNKQGDIVGAATKELNNHIIYLLNNATPDVLIHEVTHIFLNTVTRAMNSGQVHARFSQTIGNVLDVIGAPEGPNNVFSERQQEQLASLFQEIGKTGMAPSLQLQESFAQVQQIAKGAMQGAKAVGEFNPKVKKLFADFFAPFKAKLDIDTSVENVNNMKRAIADIKAGRRPSVRDVVMLTKLLQFGRGYRPGWIGYSVEDYIKEHPEYNEATPSEKRAMLEKEGFEIASERETFADDNLAMQAVEANADRTFRKDDTSAIKRREEIAKYNEIAQVYREVFENNKLMAAYVGNEIKRLRQQGYVVADRDFVSKLSKDLTQLKKSFVAARKKIASLEEQVKNLKAAKQEQKAQMIEKQALADAKATGRQITDMLFGVSVSLSDVGVDVDTLTKLGQELDEALQTNDLTKITEKESIVMEELETYSNRLLEEYYNSDFYKEQEGINPPVVDVKAANSALLGIITKQVVQTKVGSQLNFSKIYSDIDRMLQKQGVPTDTRYKILRDLNKQRINIATGRNVDEIVQKVIDDANKTYRKDMYSRTDSLFKKLLSKAKGKKLIGNDNTAVIRIGDIVNQMEKIASQKSLPTRKAALDDFINQLSFNDIVVGQDEKGNPIKMNPEQALLALAVVNETRARLTDDQTVPNEMLQNAYKEVDSFDKFTQERVQRFQAQKAELLKKRVSEAIQLVAERKGLPSYAQKLDSMLFAGPLGGLRSNLIAVFGEEYANKMDATVGLALASAQLKRYRDIVNDFIVAQTRGGMPQTYKSHLQIDIPYANPRNNIEQLLSQYTRGQLLDLWMISKNDKGFRWVQRTFGDNAQAVVDYLNSGKGISTLDKNIGSFMMSLMREIYPQIAYTYETITGKPLGYQADYWPLYVMTRQSSEIVLDDMMYFNANPVTKEGPGMTKERVGVATDPSVNPERVLRLDDPIDKFDRYFRTATKYINVTPKMNIISEIVRGNSPESQQLRTDIKNKFGKGMLEGLMNDIEYVLGVQRYKEQSAMNKAINEVLSNFVIGKIAMVPWIGVKQTVAIINYADRMPTGAFVRGLLQGLSHPVQTWKEMMSYKAVYNRFKGQIPMAFMENKSLQTEMLLGLLSNKQRQAIGERTVANISAGISKAKSLAMYNVRLGDAMSVVYGGYAYVQYLKEQVATDPNLSKMSAAEKQTYIEEQLISMTETSQQSGLDTTKGSLQRSEDIDGALLKRALMTFSSANSQYVRKLREALYEYRNGKISRTQAMKTFAIYGLLNPVMFAMLSMPGLWAAMFRASADGDDEEARKKIYMAFLRPIFDNVFSAYGNMGGTAEMFTDWSAKMAGQETFGIDGDMSPFFVKDLERALNMTSKTKQEVSAEEWIDALLMVGQGLSPLPLQNIKKMLKGMYGVTTDEEAWEKWASAATVLGISERQAKQLFEEE